MNQFTVYVVQRGCTPHAEISQINLSVSDRTWGTVGVSRAQPYVTFRWFSRFRSKKLIYRSRGNTSRLIQLDVLPRLPWYCAPLALSVGGRPVVRDKIGDYIIPSHWSSIVQVSYDCL